MVPVRMEWVVLRRLQMNGRNELCEPALAEFIGGQDRKSIWHIEIGCKNCNLLSTTDRMRSEALDEAVSVRADFHGGSVTPVAFRRRGREHRVARVNARWVDRAGKHPCFYFSVADESGDVYQLQLQGADLVWRVDTVSLEG